MKTTTTITLDIKLKEKAMGIIQNKLKSSLSSEVEKLLKKIIEKNEK